MTLAVTHVVQCTDVSSQLQQMLTDLQSTLLRGQMKCCLLFL